MDYGEPSSCEQSLYPCTEKNTERTYLFSFKLATYNTALLNPTQPERDCRGREIGKKIASSYDWEVVLVQEGFDGDAIEALASEAGCKQGPNQTYSCSFHKPPAGLKKNGGLGVLSQALWSYRRWEAWNACGGLFGGGSDCLANKGFDHLRLVTPYMISPIDVVNLHLDAGARDAHVRRSQLKQLSWETDAYPNSTILLGGDFNIVGPPCVGAACADVWEWEEIPLALDFAGRSGEFQDAYHTLHPTSEGVTADSAANSLKSCTYPPGGPDCRRERLDYVWFSDERNCYDLELTSAEVVVPQAVCGDYVDLSDHYALEVLFSVYKSAGVDNCKEPDPAGGTSTSPPVVTLALPDRLVVGDPVDDSDLVIMASDPGAHAIWDMRFNPELPSSAKFEWWETTTGQAVGDLDDAATNGELWVPFLPTLFVPRTLSLSVENDRGAIGTAYQQLWVEPNDPPELGPVEDRVLEVRDTLVYTIHAQDDNSIDNNVGSAPQTLSATLKPQPPSQVLPPGSTFSRLPSCPPPPHPAAQGHACWQLTYTAGKMDDCFYRLVVEVGDGQVSDADTFIIEVLDAQGEGCYVVP